MKKKTKSGNMSDRILDFEDLKERFEAERLANERCRKESAKLVVKKKLPLKLIKKCYVRTK